MHVRGIHIQSSTAFLKEKHQSLKMAKQVLPSQEDDSLSLEAVRVWTEKDTVYRLGNSASLFYEKSINHTTLKKSPYTSSIVSQLQTELHSTKTELHSAENRLQQQQLISMEEQQQRMEEQTTQLEQQQRKMEEQEHRMEKHQRMLEAKCEMMEDQKQALLGLQFQKALKSSLPGHPPELHDSEK
ncbi:hypothetical protein Cgig2_022202 [Carnegiea gigantea]|uniref:Uncharacterized protein n=1 Tax=Carnegiea gigantea TaxID=171969 RepID=A0A9Q1JJ45_9CARY|nr:hypothetical protein Cgig2_022202 [Carnegiea gigantea]